MDGHKQTVTDRWTEAGVRQVDRGRCWTERWSEAGVGQTGGQRQVLDRGGQRQMLDRHNQ